MTSIGIRHTQHQPLGRPAQGTVVLERLPLLSGVLSSTVYVLADQVSALRYPAYSLVDQAISELSAMGAPTARLWSAFMLPYEILIPAFAIGVLRVAGRQRAVRASGWSLLAFALSGPLWSFFPMHQRGSEPTWQDTGHVIMGGATIVLFLLFIGFGAFALGRRFRVYSLVTMLAVLVAGVGTFAFVERVAAAQPTPWLGVIERVMIYGYLFWVAAFAVALLLRSQRVTSVQEIGR